jgi:RsiW-degrading membrane proteinase PrsW (M82 family)
MLADAPRPAELVQTAVFDALDAGATEEVRKIIAANMGQR